MSIGVFRSLSVGSSAVLFCLMATTAQAQLGGAVGGVYIDAQGIVREVSTLDEGERLKLMRHQAELQPTVQNVLQASGLRKVSLKRLEAEVAKLHADGKPLPAELQFLAGLERIQYVFFYPEENDVVIAGPAGAWRQLPSGDVVNVKTNRPVLHLDDLIVALRASVNPRPQGFISCSIEPTPQGMQNYVRYMNSIRSWNRSQLPQIFSGIQNAMGPQAVKFTGVPQNSSFAFKMLAADYRLKRIAMSLDPSPVPGVVNYMDLAAKRFRGGTQPQHQWWFEAGYDAIVQTEDQLAFELQGQGVQVIPWAQGIALNDPNPKRRPTPAAKQFATGFNKNFAKLSQAVPVFAELENLVSLSVASELIAEKVFQVGEQNPGWTPKHFLDPQACPTQEYQVPKRVPSLVSYRFVKGRHWMISVSGGVSVQMQNLASEKVRKPAEGTSLSATRTRLRKPQPNWWWD